MESKQINKLPKLLVLLGPTGSGKSSLSLHIAKKFNGEVVIADSRQVYRYFSIGTNKDQGVWKIVNSKKKYIVDGVTIHCIDFVHPTKSFSLYEYQKCAVAAIEEILSRNKLPILSGGTGMYIRAVTNNWEITGAKAPGTLRKKLEQKSNIELINEIKAISKKKLDDLDIFNKRRLARVLEVFYTTGKILQKRPSNGIRKYNILKLGIDCSREKLYEIINLRVDTMMKAGLLDEVRELSKKFDATISVFSSIGYRELRAHIEGTKSLDEAVEEMKVATRRYARKQLTWWRRENDIRWLSEEEEFEKEIISFLK